MLQSPRLHFQALSACVSNLSQKKNMRETVDQPASLSSVDPNFNKCHRDIVDGDTRSGNLQIFLSGRFWSAV